VVIFFPPLYSGSRARRQDSGSSVGTTPGVTPSSDGAPVVIVVRERGPSDDDDDDDEDLATGMSSPVRAPVISTQCVSAHNTQGRPRTHFPSPSPWPNTHTHTHTHTHNTHTHTHTHTHTPGVDAARANPGQLRRPSTRDTAPGRAARPCALPPLACPCCLCSTCCWRSGPHLHMCPAVLPV
jgi:hypothetical protein